MANKKKDSGPPPSPTTIEDTLAEELDQVWRMLKEAAEQQKMGMEAVKPMRLLLIRVFGQLLRLQEKIDAAYGGQPFDYRYAPMSPMNFMACRIVHCGTSPSPSLVIPSHDSVVFIRGNEMVMR
jgi:hypothetical protein